MRLSRITDSQKMKHFAGEMYTVSQKNWATFLRPIGYNFRNIVVTCESFFFVRIESQIESAVYHASRNTA